MKKLIKIIIFIALLWLGFQYFMYKFFSFDGTEESIERMMKIMPPSQKIEFFKDFDLASDTIKNIELKHLDVKFSVKKSHSGKDYRIESKNNEKFDLTMCNPPFHSSLEAAIKANERKVSNLNKGNKEIKKGFNFGGQKAELWCNGGELLFLKKMAKESVKFSSQVNWFTSLVSDKDNIKPLIKLLEKLGTKEVKVLEMSQGQKISRVLAWKF